MKHMGTAAVFTIGELAKRTGLPVKTIRFYSDEGLLPPTDRTDAGYRLYDATAMARLELVRTLRELGLGLADVERALTREATIGDLAVQHVAALDEQIRRLELRRAVLRAVAKRDSPLEEVELMNKLASMADEDRKRLLDEFWADMVEGLELDPQFYERMRSAKPELPDDPTPEQLEAWIEFAELVQDEEFRASIRRMSEWHSKLRKEDGADFGEKQQQLWIAWSAKATEALEAGLAPDSAEGRELAETIFTQSSRNGRDPADPAWRKRLTDGMAISSDPRAERYWHLLGKMNGWPSFPSQMREAEWIIAALRSALG